MERRPLIVVLVLIGLLGCSTEPSPLLEVPPLDELTHPENQTALALSAPALPAPVVSVAGPDEARFAIAGEGLRFIEPPDFEAPADADADNVYALLLGLGENEEARRLNVRVRDVDEPPVFSGPERVTVEEGERAVPTPRATDPEGAMVAIAVSGPDASSFTIDGEGKLTFTTPPDFEAPGDADFDNLYDLSLVARDAGGLTATRTLVVAVSDRTEGPEPDVRVRFPIGTLAEGASIAVVVDAPGFSPAAELRLISAESEGPRLEHAGGTRWRGRYVLGAPERTVRAREGDIEATAAFAAPPVEPRVVRRPIAVGTSGFGGPTWALDADGPRALTVEDGAVLQEIALPDLAARDIEPLPGGREALVLGRRQLFRVSAEGRARRLEIEAFTEARAVAVLPDGSAALVLEPDALHWIDLDPPVRALLSGAARGSGPALREGLDLTTDGRQAFLQLAGTATSGRPLFSVDLRTGDRSLLVIPPGEGSSYGVAYLGGSTGPQTLQVLSGPRVSAIRIPEGDVFFSSVVRDDLGQPLEGARLGRGVGAGDDPLLARPLPPLLAPVRGRRPSVQRRFSVVGTGLPFGPIDALAPTERGLVAVLGRDRFGVIQGSQRTVYRFRLPAPAAFALDPEAPGGALVADRDEDLLFRVWPPREPEPLPDPAETAGRGFEAPIAVAAIDERAAWVLEAVPPSLFRFDGRAWSLPLPELDLGFPAAASFVLEEGAMYLLDGATNGVARVDLETGARRELDGGGPSPGRLRAIAASADGVFVLDANDAIYRVDPATGERAEIASDARGGGGSLAGATSLAADGESRVFVGRSDGAVLAVEIGSGDRTFVAR